MTRFSSSTLLLVVMAVSPTVAAAQDAKPLPSPLALGDVIRIAIDPGRSLVLARAPASGQFVADRPAADWALAEVRAGRALIALSTQDQFVPQMVNLELAGGVDFRKGCYPGQEIVARAQYRGTVKRRMFRLKGAALRAGRPKDAEAVLRPLLEKNPDDYHVAEVMAQALLARGAAVEAVGLAQRIVKKRPKRASYRVLLGDALRRAGDEPSAKLAYKEALALDPKMREAQKRLKSRKVPSTQAAPPAPTPATP